MSRSTASMSFDGPDLVCYVLDMSLKKISDEKAGKPVARITKYQGLAEPRKLGMLKGQIKVHGDLKDPMPADVGAAFGIASQQLDAPEAS